MNVDVFATRHVLWASHFESLAPLTGAAPTFAGFAGFAALAAPGFLLACTGFFTPTDLLNGLLDLPFVALTSFDATEAFLGLLAPAAGASCLRLLAMMQAAVRSADARGAVTLPVR